jgi:signal transduction histidine kinase
VLLLQARDTDTEWSSEGLEHADWPPFVLVRADDWNDASARLAEGGYDVCIIDAGVPEDASARALLTQKADCPVLFLGRGKAGARGSDRGSPSCTRISPALLKLVSRTIRKSTAAKRDPFGTPLEHVACAVCLRDTRGNIYYRNKRFARSFHEAKFSRSAQRASRSAWFGESGGRNWLFSRFAVASDMSERIIEGIAAIDVSERGYTEETLHVRDKEMAGILDGLPVIAGSIDGRGTITSCRGGALELFGEEGRRLVGRDMFDLPGMPGDKLRAALAGETVRFLWRIRTRSEMRSFACCFRGYTAPNSGAAGFALDVTSRMPIAAPAEVPEAELLRALTERLSVVTGSLDRHGRVVEIAGSAALRRACSADHWIGRDLRAVFPEGALALDRALSGDCTETFVGRVAATATTHDLHVHFLENRDGLGPLRFFARDVSERKRLERELVENVDRQRMKIGADLHDDIAQLLTGAACLGRALSEKTRAGEPASAHEVETLASIACEALGKIREFAHTMTDRGDPRGRLSDALARLADRARQLHGIECDVSRVQVEERPHPPETTRQLVRICQEAVSNAVRHGRAGRIELAVNYTASGLELRVVDDGLGFDPAATPTGAGLGLMRYRASLVGGSLHLHSTPGEGTSLAVRLPIHTTP